MRETRDAKINIRATEGTKAALRELADKLSAELGTRITQTQAIEIAVKEAIARRASA